MTPKQARSFSAANLLASSMSSAMPADVQNKKLLKTCPQAKNVQISDLFLINIKTKEH